MRKKELDNKGRGNGGWKKFRRIKSIEREDTMKGGKRSWRLNLNGWKKREEVGNRKDVELKKW